MTPEELKSICNNPAASASQKRAAAQALAALGENTPTPADRKCSPLAAELLEATGASSLHEIEESEVCQFLDMRHTSPDQRSALLTEYMVEQCTHHPATRQRCEQMAAYLRQYFAERNTALMHSLREAMDSGRSTQAIREEIFSFYRDWADSVVLPESVKATIRKTLSGEPDGR